MNAMDAASELDAVWRILLAEDNRTLRLVLKAMLARRPEFTVREAADGQEAWEILEADGFGFDLVVTDIEMPRMGGEELIARVIGANPRIAIVVLTGHANDASVLRCLQLGAADYLVKPCKEDEFIRALHRLLDRRLRFSRDGRRDLRVEAPVEGWVELTAPTDFEYVERFTLFMERLDVVPLDPSVREAIRAAIGELGHNAVEWGNKNDRAKTIRIAYCLFADRLVLKIEDEGEGFDVQALRDPTADPLAHVARRMAEGKRPGGYGTFMIRQLFDEVLYSDAGNVVLLTKFLTPHTKKDEP
jgi:CheY-like chemotaxis protein/anti-sigma regulatory factor (Ser/Thr protein kinase)